MEKKQELIRLYRKKLAKEHSKMTSEYHAFQRKTGEVKLVHSVYGYSRDEKRNIYVPNPDTAPTVQLIFRWFLMGYGMGKIAERLNRVQMMTPLAYKAVVERKEEAPQTDAWNASRVKDILRNSIYIGELTCGRRRKSLCENMPEHRTDKEEWVIFHHMHEPIVAKEDFYEVQRQLDAAAKKHPGRVKKVKKCVDVPIPDAEEMPDLSPGSAAELLYKGELSARQKRALREKWKQGISTAGRLPFGYVKSARDTKNAKGGDKWQLDEPAASYVRLIFEKAIEGWSTKQIAGYLNEQDIPTPGAYKEQHTEAYRQWNRQVKDGEWLWDAYMVRRILQNEVYTGKLVHYIREKEGKEKTVEGAHPPIVSAEEYANAQSAVRRTSSHAAPQKSGWLLGGKVRCGNCGLRMAYEETAEPVVLCRHRQQVGKYSKCDPTRYKAAEIEQFVLQKLKEHFRKEGVIEAVDASLQPLAQDCLKANELTKEMADAFVETVVIAHPGEIELGWKCNK